MEHSERMRLVVVALFCPYLLRALRVSGRLKMQDYPWIDACHDCLDRP